MIIAMGGGLLGLAPMFCMLSGLYHMRLLHRLLPEEALPRRTARKSTYAGVLLVAVLTGLYAGPALYTKHLVKLAISDDAAERERAVDWIRTLHLEGAVLEACYALPGMQIFGGGTEIWDERWASDRSAYYALYYRITGRSHRSVPRPEMPGISPIAGRVAFDETVMETWNDIGGTEVAGRARGLRLKASAMDVNVTTFKQDGSGPAIAYIEWILEFRNTDNWEKEARAHIDMPPDAVPSRLTLWIDGEEREAAYGTREQTREAYRKVVERRRDPALLNVVGPGVAMLQCYPVPPSGTMKVKVGFTAPLPVRNGKSFLRLPYISECNFDIGPKLEHAVWVESTVDAKARAATLSQEQSANGTMTLRGKLTEEILQNSDTATLEFPYLSADGSTFAGELNGTRAESVPGPATAAEVSKLCFVLDGSVFMRDVPIDWNRVVQSLDGNVQVTAVFAGQKVETFSDSFFAPDAGFAAWLASRTFEGGCDAVPALEKAWNLVSSSAPAQGAVVWVHGPQLIELSSSEGLQQLLRRRPANGQGLPALLSIQVKPGPNRALNSLTGMVERVPLVSSLEDTLVDCAKGGTGNDLQLTYRLTQEAEPGNEDSNSSAMEHMVRLAVNNDVLNATASDDPAWKTTASKRAQSVRIVTPLTGAVVLQTKQQYAEAGLDPSADEDAIPGIPEPSEWALLIAVAVVLAATAMKSRAVRRNTVQAE